MKKIRVTNWLEQRKKGLGGSDAAIACGLSPWKSSITLYLEKLGKRDSAIDNKFTYWGKQLEDLVAKEFTGQTGLKVRRNNFILQSDDHPFMLANLDRVGIDEDGKHFVLECKTTSNWNQKKWDGEDIPIDYYLQVMHYLIVTDYDYAYIAVLIGGNDFRYMRIERDAELEKLIIDKEKTFWQNIQDRVMPTVDGSDDSNRILSELYPTATAQSTLNLAVEREKILQERIRLNSEIDALTTRKKEIENIIKMDMGENETAFLPHFRISWKNTIRTSLDSKKFKEEKSDLFNMYRKTTKYRKFNVSEVSA